MLVERGYEPSGHPPASPRFSERAVLFIGNKAFRVRHAIGRYGLGLYLRSLMASRLGTNAWRDACQTERNMIDIRYLK